MFESQSQIRRVLAGLIGFALFIPACTPLQAQREKAAAMSAQEAEQFALAAVPLNWQRLPDFQFDHPPQKTPEGFYVFNAIWQGKPEGSVELGFYSVDPVTGTVWNPVAECQRISTKPLRRLQEQRRQQLGLTDSKLRELEIKGPMCS